MNKIGSFLIRTNQCRQQIKFNERSNELFFYVTASQSIMYDLQFSRKELFLLKGQDFTKFYN
jgi:hypothetical protein